MRNIKSNMIKMINNIDDEEILNKIYSIIMHYFVRMK